MMTDKQMEEKKKEFFYKFLTEVEHYQGESEPLIERLILDDKIEDVWSWIAQLVEEVEEEKYLEGYEDARAKFITRHEVTGGTTGNAVLNNEVKY